MVYKDSSVELTKKVLYLKEKQVHLMLKHLVAVEVVDHFVSKHKLTDKLIFSMVNGDSYQIFMYHEDTKLFLNSLYETLSK